MILALATFSFALVQLLFEKSILSSHHRANFYITVTVLSTIPLIFQFVIFLGELSRAGKHFIGVIILRAISQLAGNYGPSGNLVVYQYSKRRFGDYPELQGTWFYVCIIYVGHALAYFLGFFIFNDAFSGLFTMRYVSLALWLVDAVEPEVWDGCQKPKVDGDIFSKSHVKDVRHVNLVAEFTEWDGEGGRDAKKDFCYREPDGQDGIPVIVIEEPNNETLEQAVAVASAQSTNETLGQNAEESSSRTRACGRSGCVGIKTGEGIYAMPGHDPANVTAQLKNATLDEQNVDFTVHCRVIATGNQENHISQLFYREYAGACTEEAAEQFCTLLETLNNDSFVVKVSPPDKDDQILLCEDKLDTIVLSILNDGKKLCAKRVYGMTYV